LKVGADATAISLDAGPNPSRRLAASVANCLSASLLFALSKFKNTPGQITTSVTSRRERKPDKHLRDGTGKVLKQRRATAA
jgi:uncharacterized OsmC-like protein